MHYQIFFVGLCLWILTIACALDLPYLDESNVLSKLQSEKNILHKISSSIENDSKQRRQTPMNSNDRNKPLPRFLKYDFLLRQWILRKAKQQ